MKKQDYPKRRELYEKGLKDQEIADKVGKTRANISAWRWKRNLPPNGMKEGLPEELATRLNFGW